MGDWKELYTENFPMLFEAYCNDTKIYGEKIRKERERISAERGKTYTVRDLASDLGIKHSTVTKIENGNRAKINIDYLNMMCNIFNCSYLYLLGKSEYRTALTANYCYPNPRNNTELLEKINSFGSVFTVNEKKVTSPEYVSKILIDEAHSNPTGITVKNEKAKYKVYYFLKGQLTKPKLKHILTRAEESNMFESEFEQALYYNDSIVDIIIIQDLTTRSDMIRFTEPKKDNLTLYLSKLQDLFFEDYTRIKNYSLLDFLHEIRNIDKINNSDLLFEVLKVFHTEGEKLTEDDVYSLLQIIKNYYDADEDKRKAMFKASYE